PNGVSAASPTVIHVSGFCKGPTLLRNRTNITVEGDPPANNTCPPTPRGGLTSTIIGDSSVTPPSGSNGEVFNVTSGNHVTVRFLSTLRAGFAAVAFKQSSLDTGNTTCVAFANEAWEIDNLPGGHQITNNLIFQNFNGIHVHNVTMNNVVSGNISMNNTTEGI